MQATNWLASYIAIINNIASIFIGGYSPGQQRLGVALVGRPLL